MNIPSTSLPTLFSTGQTPAKSTGGAPTASGSDSANAVSLLRKNAASSRSSASDASSSSHGPVAALEVGKQLKELSKQLIALALIQDPAQRAKAAADLYKKYAQVAKDYAAGTADGREAVAAAEAIAANGSVAGSATLDADGNVVATASAPATASAETDGADQNSTTPDVLPPQEGFIVPGAKSRFVPDLFMEQIKTFAKVAEQMYEAAVQEARHKHPDKSKVHGTGEGMRDAKDMLTEAAKEVEGPDATTEPATLPPASIVDVTA